MSRLFESSESGIISESVPILSKNDDNYLLILEILGAFWY